MKITSQITGDSSIVADEIHLLKGFGVADDCVVKLYAKRFFLGACKLETMGNFEMHGMGPNAVVTASEGFKGFFCSSGKVSLGTESGRKSNFRSLKAKGLSRVTFTGLEFLNIRTNIFVSTLGSGVSFDFSKCAFNNSIIHTLLSGHLVSVTMDQVTFLSSQINAFCRLSHDLPSLELRRVKTENCVFDSIVTNAVDTASPLACGQFEAFACVLNTKEMLISANAIRIVDAVIVSERSSLNAEDFCIETSLLKCGVLELSCGNSRIIQSAVSCDKLKYEQIVGFLPVESALYSSLLMCSASDLESFLKVKTPHRLNGAMLIPKEASLSVPVSISIPSSSLCSTSHSLLLGNLQLEGELQPSTGVVVHQVIHDDKAYLFAFDYYTKRQPTRFPPLAESYRVDIEELLKMLSSELPNRPLGMLFHVDAMSANLRRTYFCEPIDLFGLGK